jgi:hypothetical protein
MGDIMEFTESNHLFGSNVKPELPHLGNALPAKCPSIFKLNQTLDSIRIPSMFNEQTIENFLQNLEEIERTDQPEYWMLMARIFELALFCAGHYADNCEFSAAGNLLVNPRKVLIHQKGCPHSLVKQRHGRISEQLNEGGRCGKDLFLLLKHEVTIEIVKPAILPYLFEQMKHSKQIAIWYLHHAEQRMKKIADTIGFLSAWSVSRFEELHKRIHEAPPEMRRFVADHLCRFDTRYFERLGREIQRLIKNSGEPCDFLNHP